MKERLRFKYRCSDRGYLSILQKFDDRENDLSNILMIVKKRKILILNYKIYMCVL